MAEQICIAPLSFQLQRSLCTAGYFDPTVVGDEIMMPTELRRRHSAREMDEATREWAIVVEGVAYPPLSCKIFKSGSQSLSQGHRVVAGKSLKSGSSREGLLSKISGLAILRPLANAEGGRSLGVDGTRRRCRERPCMPRHSQDRGFATSSNRSTPYPGVWHGMTYSA